LVCGNAKVLGNASVSEGVYTSIVINIILRQFSITVLSTGKLQIGCQLKSIEDWLIIDKSQAIEMGLDEVNFKLFKTMVEALSKCTTIS
jgi:hypothetical protein